MTIITIIIIIFENPQLKDISGQTVAKIVDVSLSARVFFPRALTQSPPGHHILSHLVELIPNNHQQPDACI